MEDMYRFHDAISSSRSENSIGGVVENNSQFYTPPVVVVAVVDNNNNNKLGGGGGGDDDQVVVDGMMMMMSSKQRLELSDHIKTQIANHPRYPDLVSAHIQCRKVGAPPEMALLLDEIGRQNQPNSRISEIGADPELDEFMESYCEVLHKYKKELSKPFDEATTFLSNIESQLSNLCKGGLTTAAGGGNYHSDEAGGSSEEELSCGEAEASESQECSDPRLSDQELKERLLQKYSGYLSSLRKEFLKKRKKGKLPKDARTTLLDWWNAHYRWPYPTEEEKMKLSEITGLDQKQINNWFINQRKRHWKPSEDMRFALMEGGGGGGDNGGGTL